MVDSPTVATLVQTGTKFHSSSTSTVAMCVVRRKRKGMRASKEFLLFDAK